MVLVHHPEGTSLAEAAHEAVKLLAGGLAISTGVLFEEAVEKAVASTGALAPVAPYLAPVLAGIGTGLVTVAAMHALDRADPFGVCEADRQRRTLDGLEARIVASLDALEDQLGPYPVSG